jgi:hypothetical protein
MKDNQNIQPSNDEISINNLMLKSFEGVGQFKSIVRAIRKGYVTPYGYVAPRRPFNNRKDKSRSGRGLNTIKKGIYADIKTRLTHPKAEL